MLFDEKNRNRISEEILANRKLYSEDGEHIQSKILYDKVSDWHNCPFPFSKSFGWDRWGLLGTLGSFVLTWTPVGDILEIGVCESSIYFTKLGKQFNRKCFHCDIQGGIISNCNSIKSFPGYFGDDATIFVGSSDDFFKEVEIPSIALAFIDGEHTYLQVKKDFWNTYDKLVDDGYIFLHDTYPPNDTFLHTSYCGDVYKLRHELEKDDRVDCFTFTKSAWGVGLTMVRKRPSHRKHYQ